MSCSLDGHSQLLGTGADACRRAGDGIPGEMRSRSCVKQLAGARLGKLLAEVFSSTVCKLVAVEAGAEAVKSASQFFAAHWLWLVVDVKQSESFPLPVVR